jgi:hypothetical protein
MARTFDCTLGLKSAVNQKIVNNKIEIYPNPSTGIFEIHSSLVKDKAELEISNINGQIILKEFIQNNNIVLDLSNRPKGVYFLRLLSGEEILMRKIVVQ